MAEVKELSPITPSMDWFEETNPPRKLGSEENPSLCGGLVGEPSLRGGLVGEPSLRGGLVEEPPLIGRRFFHWAILFVCLFLIVRTLLVEPYGVPTGSMAPAMLGHHREAICSRCGYRVVVGEPVPGSSNVYFGQCECPNCDQLLDMTKAERVAGDRLMVDKMVYSFRTPRRWEIAVFQCPIDVSKPYVKRTIGLPGERIKIFDGDVYADGKLLRKRFRQIEQMQVPVFDMNHAPQPMGWNNRWLIEKLPLQGTILNSKPTVADVVDDTFLYNNAIYLDASDSALGLTYRHWNIDRACEEPIDYNLAYNGARERNRQGFRNQPHAAHDLIVRFDLEVKTGSGPFAIALGDGADHMQAILKLGQNGSITLAHEGGTLRKTVAVELPIGETHRIEFAFVDRRGSLRINGKELIEPLDLPARSLNDAPRSPLARPLRLGVREASVIVRNLKISRDIHYVPGSRDNPNGWQLGDDEYFMLGDNTTNSLDSREWIINDKPAPGVAVQSFMGKPFLIHQPMRLSQFEWNSTRRTMQTIDLERMGWLR